MTPLPSLPPQVLMITTPTIMYLGFATHKVARMGDPQYHPVRHGCKSMPIVTRGAAHDYEEAMEEAMEDGEEAIEDGEEAKVKVDNGMPEGGSAFGALHAKLKKFIFNAEPVYNVNTLFGYLYQKSLVIP